MVRDVRHTMPVAMVRDRRDTTLVATIKDGRHTMPVAMIRDRRDVMPVTAAEVNRAAMLATGAVGQANTLAGMAVLRGPSLIAHPVDSPRVDFRPAADSDIVRVAGVLADAGDRQVSPVRDSGISSPV
jgi:hypothetical protein